MWKPQIKNNCLTIIKASAKITLEKEIARLSVKIDKLNKEMLEESFLNKSMKVKANKRNQLSFLCKEIDNKKEALDMIDLLEFKKGL